MRESASGSRPFTCALLDTESGACLVYEARPIECRTYGFYLERDGVLGCELIEALAAEPSNVIWGNHEAVMVAQEEFGPLAPLYEWLTAGGTHPLRLPPSN